MTSDPDGDVKPPSEIQQRSGAAFDRILGNSVNTGIAAWVAATTGSPEAGAAIGGMVGPLAEELSFALRKAIDIQQAQGGYMLTDAATKAETTPDELLEKLIADPVKLQLLLRSLEVAARATTEAKLNLTAELLSTGALAADRAVVDEQILVVEAIGGLETPHFRLMLVLANPSPVWWEKSEHRAVLRFAWPEDRVIERDAGLEPALTALVAKLQSLGIARDVGSSNVGRPLWELTNFGRLCVASLRHRDDVNPAQ
ncbi:hypothetical protein KBX50_08585 [Micromonospora sp. C51]|uniref:hypothetical protein n=1 Tax=Micromonospora sp. C51 TaxID=2824879 RepID=UPI001B3998E4|nr:hypothetical protein [Micromonospora sp. C51]MBQ1048515.1 hypothetical protein [Micromonospora sp. C51]